MKFSHNDIGTIAGGFLRSLELEGVKSIDSLKEKVGSSLGLDAVNSIIFDQKQHTPPSGIGISYIASYHRGKAGLPIEFRVNEIAGCALIIAKSQLMLPDYGRIISGDMGKDSYGNIYQNKENRNAGFDWVIQELEGLASLAEL